MKFTIAIHSDDYGGKEKPLGFDASSPRWTTLLEAAGHCVRPVDVYGSNIIEQLRGCDGFMWRWAHMKGMFQIARRLFPVVERELGLTVYPDQNTCWHYDDKIAQAYLFESVGIPSPRTWVWFERNSAEQWARQTSYPCVIKLTSGAGSKNVELVRNSDEALTWIDRLFHGGLKDFSPPVPSPTWDWPLRLRSAILALRKGRPPMLKVSHPWPLHKNYVYFQEFLPDNPYDTRVTIIGNRAFAFRRFNRVNDFRASGSGKIDWDPAGVDPSFVRLAFETARRLRMQSCAIDGLYRNGEPVVGEVSYTYQSTAVHTCPGHWCFDLTTPDTRLDWVEGHKWPEEAQIEDFLVRLNRRDSVIATI